MEHPLSEGPESLHAYSLMDSATSVRCIFLSSTGHICDACDPIEDTQYYLVTTMLGLSESFRLCSVSIEIDNNVTIECRADSLKRNMEELNVTSLEELNVTDLHSVVFHCLFCGNDLNQRFVIQWRVSF